MDGHDVGGLSGVRDIVVVTRFEDSLVAVLRGNVVSGSKKVNGPHESLTYTIIGAAMNVHNRIGPGQRERFYHRDMEYELVKAGLSYESEPWLPVDVDGRRLGYYIPDLVVEEKVIVELKAFSALPEKYLGQVVTYLNHSGLEVGLLINFGAGRLCWRRVFPSPQARGQHRNTHWLFVPNNLND